MRQIRVPINLKYITQIPSGCESSWAVTFMRGYNLYLVCHARVIINTSPCNNRSEHNLQCKWHAAWALVTLWIPYWVWNRSFAAPIPAVGPSHHVCTALQVHQRSALSAADRERYRQEQHRTAIPGRTNADRNVNRPDICLAATTLLRQLAFFTLTNRVMRKEIIEIIYTQITRRIFHDKILRLYWND